MEYEQTAGASKGNRVEKLGEKGQRVLVRCLKTGSEYSVSKRDFDRYYKKI
jgi:hypothetical protein